MQPWEKYASKTTQSDPLEAALELENITGQKADIARSIYMQESGGGKNTKTSNAGARGGMQIIPATFNRMADKGWAIDDPVQNARAGVRYINTLYDKAGGDPALTAAGYYGGEGAITKAKRGIAVSDPRNPKAPNTLQYGQQVAARLPKQEAQPTSAPWEKYAQVEQPQAPQPPQEQGYRLTSPSFENVLNNSADLAIGLGQGAADIGDTILNAATSVIGNDSLNNWNRERNAGLEQFNAENNNGMNITGRIAGNIAGTAGVGGVLAKGAQALNKFKLANALKSGGFNLGGAPAATTGQTVANAATRVTGAAATGAASGALIDPNSTLEAGALSAAIPVIGKAGGVIGQTVGKAKSKVLGGASPALKQAKNTQVDELQKAGYVLPPQDVDAGMGSQILNAMGGKIKTEQKASVLNQPVTNKMIADDLGLNADEPITRNALADVRKKAGEAYEVAKNYGKITADDVFKADIKKISDKYSSAGADFPELVGDDINNLINSLNKEAFESSSAISAIKVLREKADKAYRSGDASLGKATKEAANSLEDMIGRHLEKSGASKKVLENYRNARKTIAKTYTVDKALNETTGNVSAVKLGKQLEKGKPLEGNMKQVAEFGRYFAKSAQDAVQGVNPYSVLDGAGAAFGVATMNPGIAAYVASRPAARSLVLNKTYQKAFVGNNKMTIGKLLGNKKTQQAITKSAPALSSREN